jgi:hypothetical protein
MTIGPEAARLLHPSMRGKLLTVDETEPMTSDRPESPGDWFVADFDGVCSDGLHPILPGTVVRDDGYGGTECSDCHDDEGD